MLYLVISEKYTFSVHRAKLTRAVGGLAMYRTLHAGGLALPQIPAGRLAATAS